MINLLRQVFLRRKAAKQTQPEYSEKYIRSVRSVHWCEWTLIFHTVSIRVFFLHCIFTLTKYVALHNFFIIIYIIYEIAENTNRTIIDLSKKGLNTLDNLLKITAMICAGFGFLTCVILHSCACAHFLLHLCLWLWCTLRSPLCARLSQDPPGAFPDGL